jgi:integrase
MTELALLEPSFVDVVAAVEHGAELSEECRQHWTCSLRQIAKWLDRPAAVIPARFNAVELALRQLHHARLGVTAKTLANHKSNIRAALHWFAKERHLPRHGMRLSAAWAGFGDRIEDRRQRDRLYSLMRYCSARGIAPGSVDDVVLEEYWRYRAETTALISNNTRRRLLARIWNTCAAGIVDCQLQRLTEPPVIAKAGPAWEDFPETLRKEIETYFRRLTQPHRGAGGRRQRPCQQATIRTRRAELMAVARTAVRLGVPIESLTSLDALLHPDVVEPVIDAYWKKNGDEPKVFTVDLGWKLLRIARETGCLDQAALDRLDEIRGGLENYRPMGLTPKNLQLIRQVLTEGVWSEVVWLPNVLMQQARSNNDHAPTKAAITAQLATAIAILIFAPIRLSNLVSIELGKNLIKPGGLNKPFWLVFPHYDVKNRVDLNFKLDQPLTDLIDEYIHEFRPAVLRATNAPWLFPGDDGDPKTANTFGIQITERIEKSIGLRITPHQFRHAAAAIYLKHRPGHYETVRQLLGHKNIQTTVDFYCGLQTMQATEQLGKIIREQIEFNPDE